MSLSPRRALAVVLATLGLGYAFAALATAQVPGDGGDPGRDPTTTATTTPTTTTTTLPPATTTTPAPAPDPAPKPVPDPTPGDPQTASEPKVDPGTYAKTVCQRFTNRSVGGSFSVAQGDKLYECAWGKRRIAADGNRDFLPTTRIEIMSATKHETALAMMRMLTTRGISVDAAVGPYLPADWVRGPGYGKIAPKPGDIVASQPVTFRQLLTHRSGLLQTIQALNAADLKKATNGWDGMRFLVAKGSKPIAKSTYKNANYSLMRILTSEMWRAAGGPATPLNADNSSFRWLDYVTKFVLQPAGVTTPARCWELDDASAAMVYDRDNTKQGGAVSEFDAVHPDGCGGHRGLHLSTNELAKVLRTEMQTASIVDAATRQKMLDGKLGWTSGADTAPWSGLWWHGGDGFMGAGREVHTCVARLTQGIVAAVAINSDENIPKTSQCSLILGEFNAERGVKAG